MSDKEYMECSVVAYPREIRFLHINGSAISYYVDRHISDYVDRLQKENEKNKHYKTLYKSLKRQKEELRSWLVEQKEKAWDEVSSTFGYVLDKLEELERVSNE